MSNGFGYSGTLSSHCFKDCLKFGEYMSDNADAIKWDPPSTSIDICSNFTLDLSEVTWDSSWKIAYLSVPRKIRKLKNKMKIYLKKTQNF